jgi:hypothetical protein
MWVSTVYLSKYPRVILLRKTMSCWDYIIIQAQGTMLSGGHHFYTFVSAVWIMLFYCILYRTINCYLEVM